MFNYAKFDKEHIPGVKKLFDEYLIPMYLRRLGITKEEITDEIMDFEAILNPEVTSDACYRDCSVVCIDSRTNEIVGCLMNYFLNEEEYKEMYVDIPKRYLKRENQPETVRSYAESLIRNYVNVFEIFNLKKIGYGETMIVIPSLRGQRISENMVNFHKKTFPPVCKAFLRESQIPIDQWEKMGQTKYQTQPNEMILAQTIHNGFVCLVKIYFHNFPLTSNM